MQVSILDDIHRAYEGTTGVSRLRDRAEVQIFTSPFGYLAALRGFDAVVANRERTRFTRDLCNNFQIFKSSRRREITHITSTYLLPKNVKSLLRRLQEGFVEVPPSLPSG